jgi:hypothetical protein
MSLVADYIKLLGAFPHLKHIQDARELARLIQEAKAKSRRNKRFIEALGF